MTLQDKVLEFFDRNKRNLPWRTDPTPYKTFVSEVMLQQTRVETVVPYFNRFIEALPDIKALASVDDERLNKLWQGLGYYSRAKNLKKAANMVVDSFGGTIPSAYEDLLRLPGIGPYAAGAIASIAFNQDTVAVDGNVLRVIARLEGIESDIRLPATKAEIESRLTKLYPKNRKGDFTEALMEIGATVCLPNGIPRCSECPFVHNCIAHLEKRINEIPFRSKPAKKQVEDFTVLLVHTKDKVWIRRRQDQGLLASLWELPNIPGDMGVDEVAGFLTERGFHSPSIVRKETKNHVFTHKVWKMTCFDIEVDAIPTMSEGCFASVSEIKSMYSVPKAFLQFLSGFLMADQS